MINATHTTPARQQSETRIHPEAAAAALRNGETITIGQLQLAVVDRDNDLLQIAIGSRSSTQTFDQWETLLAHVSAA